MDDYRIAWRSGAAQIHQQDEHMTKQAQTYLSYLSDQQELSIRSGAYDRAQQCHDTFLQIYREILRVPRDIMSLPKSHLTY